MDVHEPDEVPPTATAPVAGPGRRVRLARSFNTEQALQRPRPRMRGWFHLGAAVVAVPLAAGWTALTPSGARVGVAAFAFGVATMFVCSALLHLRPWTPHTYERLFRLDHSGIFLAISGTGVALGRLGLDGAAGRALVTVCVVGAIAGIVAEWLPFAPPRGLANGVYLTLGWSPVLLLPWLWQTAGARTVALLLVGGVLYTAGAIIVGLRRPDPVPHVFGYHEVFHVLVIAAVAVHAVMIADLAVRAA